MLSRPRATVCAAVLATAAARGDSDYAFGSGKLGTWLPDRYSLPSYALSLENLTLFNVTSDLHVVGNDRMLANVAQDGSLTLRQDEGGPKYLNDFDAAFSQFGGGIGWLFGDGASVPLCDSNVSFPPPRGRAVSMTFGVGYVEKTCSAGALSAAHTIFAPYGDLSAVVSAVTISNAGAAALRVRWLEQWAGGAPVILADNVFRPVNWTAAFEPVPPLGGSGGAPIGVLSRKANPAGDARVPSLDDPLPRPAFLVALDADAGVAFGVDGAALFPAGDPRAPALAALTNSTALPPGPDGWRRGVLAIASAWLTVPAGGAVSLYFCYGYVPDERSSAADVVAAVLAGGGRGGAPALLDASTRAWAGNLSLVLDVPALGPWVARETAWHSYVLRALLTFDSFRGRHNLNQNGEYQNAFIRGGGPPPAIGGFNGASRDSLAHVMPFAWQSPAGAAAVTETVLFWLQTQLDSGMLA